MTKYRIGDKITIEGIVAQENLQRVHFSKDGTRVAVTFNGSEVGILNIVGHVPVEEQIKVGDVVTHKDHAGWTGTVAAIDKGDVWLRLSGEGHVEYKLKDLIKL